LKRTLFFLALVACGGTRASVTATPEALPAPPPSATASAAPTPKTPLDRVHAAIGRWLDWLAQGDDAHFLDEAVLPDEWTKILGETASKDAFVKEFREGKHDRVVAILTKVRGLAPTRVEDGETTRVTYEVDGERKITFDVIGDHVYIEN